MSYGNNAIWRHGKSPSVIIPSGQTDSNGFIYDPYSFGLFVIPAAFTGASVSFKVSADGSNFYPLRSAANTLISYTVAAGTAYPFPDELGGAIYARIVSASAEGAARTIIIMAKG